MGGSDPRTLVLVGRTGNGKSATGNSILGKKTFESKRCSSGVTRTSELESIVLEDGQMLNVIDTPGLFDSSFDAESIGKEIVRCINMAVDGVHAFLLVLSVYGRFSEEETAAVSSLMTLFGKEIFDYIIVVFTGGDALEQDSKTLEEYLCDSSETLKEILCLCGNRRILFDNKTTIETKKAQQLQELLSNVNNVLDKNGGEPYTNDIFTELKKGSWELELQTFQALKETKGYTEEEMSMQMGQIHDLQLKRVNEMVVSKFTHVTKKLEQLLMEERAARKKAEEDAESDRKKSDEDLNRLREELERLKRWEQQQKKNQKEQQQKKNQKEQQNQFPWACYIL